MLTFRVSACCSALSCIAPVLSAHSCDFSWARDRESERGRELGRDEGLGEEGPSEKGELGKGLEWRRLNYVFTKCLHPVTFGLVTSLGYKLQHEEFVHEGLETVNGGSVMKCGFLLEVALHSALALVFPYPRAYHIIVSSPSPAPPPSTRIQRSLSWYLVAAE
ncbi:hypothetical protein DFH29DRAFT_1072652 [Suillus ampliporus]|nr:hypothetical protein DFH29DRAFT_1072652 [Suillus ampliporus]